MEKKLDPGYGMEKIRIRDKPPGSATLIFVSDTDSYLLNIRIRKLLFVNPDPDPGF
jgi:hypothetical protein